MHEQDISTAAGPVARGISEKLAELTELQERIKALQADLCADYDALRAALPRRRKAKATKPAKVGRPRKSKGAGAGAVA